MGLAWSLTALAICGAWIGAFLGQESIRFEHHLAAAGGGILFGISLFWLVPEAAEKSGYRIALVMTVAVAALLLFMQEAFERTSDSGVVVWLLLTATGVHSLLDGWSLRLLSIQPFANIVVTIGLALHKIPEGIAVGWITRRSLNRRRQAFLFSAGVELLTVVGAFAEPGLNASGTARFGLWWSTGVLAVIAGGFLFLALHAIHPAWRRAGVSAIFLATVLLVGALAFLHSPI